MAGTPVRSVPQPLQYLGAIFSIWSGVGHHFQGPALATGLAAGLSARLLAKAPVLPRAVLVPRRGHRTVAAVLGVLVFGKAFAQIEVLPAEMGNLLLQYLQTSHQYLYKFPVGQTFTFSRKIRNS